MTTTELRIQLQQQIAELPDDVVTQLADFTLFVMARRNIKPKYTEWTDSEWQAFALQSFFAEDDEVEYSLNDAKEVYHL